MTKRSDKSRRAPEEAPEDPERLPPIPEDTPSAQTIQVEQSTSPSAADAPTPTTTPIVLPTGSPASSTDLLQTVQFLAQELASLKQELLMRSQVNPIQQPRDMKTAILDLIGNVAAAASKFVPNQNSEVMNTMSQQMFNMMWNHFGTMDQVFLKMAGINLPPVTHMTVKE